MRQKIKQQWTVFIVLVILFNLFSITASFADIEQNSLGIADLTLIAQILKSQYVYVADENILLAGAHEGMKGFLKNKKNQEDLGDFPKDVTWNKGISIIQDEFYSLTQRHSKEFKDADLLYAAFKGMIAALKDPYTVFLDPKEHRAFMEQMSGGNFGGIGIYLDMDHKTGKQLVVVEPIEGAPAYKAGLKAGDYIMKIDGNSTEGLTTEMAQNIIRGPIGTTVVLTIKRENEVKDYAITRAIIHVRSLSFKIMENNIGYVKLRLFGENTNEELSEAFQKLETQNVKGLILDLRNNGGGYITAALDVCSKFLPKGSLIVSVIDKNGHRQAYHADGTNYKVIPLIVLINNFSASASEITAGALKDQGVTILLGQKTFGKGSVQNIQPLKDGSAIKLTIAKYTTPTGREIEKRGIEPDIAVEMSPELIGTTQDVQLRKAMEYIRSRVAQGIR